MKKLIAILVMLVLSLALVSCSDDYEEIPDYPYEDENGGIVFPPVDVNPIPPT